MIRVHDLGELTALAMSRINELDAVRAEHREYEQKRDALAERLARDRAEEVALTDDHRRLNALETQWTREVREEDAKLLDDAARNPACDFEGVAQMRAKIRSTAALTTDAITFIITRLVPAQRLKVLETDLEHRRHHEQVLLYESLIARTEAAIAVQGLLAVEGAVEISGGRSEYLLRLALDAGRATRAAHQNLIEEKSRQLEMARSTDVVSL